MEPRLTGRHEELDVATEILAQGSGLVVRGDAGVGKSRLLMAIAEQMQPHGWQIERVAGSAAAGSMQFGAVAHLLPTVPAVDRLQLLRHAQHALAARGARGPLLIVVDDAHLLDDGSAALVHRAASVTGLTVLASERLGEPLSSSVTALWKDGFVRRLELHPLPEDSTRLLVEMMLDGPVSDTLHRELWRIGRGNPLFLRELMFEGVERGSIARAGTGVWAQTGPLGVTALSELLGARLEGLRRPVREMLECAAVGEPFELELLESLDPGDHLAELFRCHLLASHSEGHRVIVTTAHPLYGEMVRVGLGSRRLRTVSATLAATVMGTGLRRRSDALRAARWQLDTGRILKPEVMVRAAAEALNGFDFALADQLTNAALAHHEADRGEALYLAGCSLSHQGRVEEADRALAEAMEAADSDHLLARVVLARAQNLFYSQRDRGRAVKLLEAALEQMPTSAALDLMAEAALYACALNDYPCAIRRCREVLDSPHAGEVTRLRTVIVYTLITGLDGRFGETSKSLDEGIRLAERHRQGLPLARYKLSLNRSLMLWGTGELTSSVEELTSSLALARAEGGPIGAVTTCLGINLVERGELVAARATLDEATVELARFDPFGNKQMAWCVLAWILAQLGRFEDARSALATLPGDPSEAEFPASLYASWADTWLAASSGDLAGAGERARSGGARALDSSHHFFGSVTLYQAVRLGAADRVADLLARSASHVGHRLVPTMADHARAMVEGDADGADAAAERFQTMGFRLAASEAYAQAAALHARGRQGVAAQRSATRSQLLQRHCPGAETPALRTRPATLSDRQIEVAVLAVGPLSSRVIAERLYLSRRTVDNHLGSIYRKLGLHGRGELRDLLCSTLSGGNSLIERTAT